MNDNSTNEPGPEQVPPVPQTPRTLKRQSKAITQATCIFVLLTVLYFLVAYALYEGLSTYWVYSFYLSPMFLISITLVSFIFISASESTNSSEFFSSDQESQEQCFFSLIILIPISLITIPAFMALYYGIYHDIISIKQHPTEGQIIYQQQFEFYSETYTVLLYQVTIDGQNQTAYGCASSNYEGSVFNLLPKPYKFYEVEGPRHFESLYKLPSWFCKDTPESQSKLYYTKIGNPAIQDSDHYQFTTDFYLITFSDPPYISKYSFLLLVTVFYQFIWFFAGIWLFLIIVYRNSLQEHRSAVESNKYREGPSQIDLYDKDQQTNQLVKQVINYPSRKRRILLIILGYLDWCFALYFALKIVEHQSNLRTACYLLMLLPGLLLLAASFRSRLHRHLITQIFIDSWNQPSCPFRILLLAITTLLLLPLYLMLFYAACVCCMNMYLFTSRVLVAHWKGVSELSEKDYNEFVNKSYIFQWIWRGPLSLIVYYLAFKQQTSVELYICITIGSIQLLLGLVVFVSWLVTCKWLSQPIVLIFRNKTIAKPQAKIQTVSELSQITMKSQM